MIPEETPAQQAVCKRHDEAYEKGGTDRDRAIADAEFLRGLLRTGMDVYLAEKYHTAVRIMGGFYFGRRSRPRNSRPGG